LADKTMDNSHPESSPDVGETRWVARLTPGASCTIEALLQMPLGLDVWHRQEDVLVVAASEAQLSEIERRRLARVERLSTVADFQRAAQQGDPPSAVEGDRWHESDPQSELN
jgi:hypothetical protein